MAKPKLAKISFNLLPEDYAMFEQAAKLCKMSLNRFLIEAAEAKANDVLQIESVATAAHRMLGK